jgi:hypothetical protein
MKKLFLFLFLANCTFFAKAQNIVNVYGEYMDTVFVSVKGCGNDVYDYYYSVDGKYPMSSPNLVKKAEDFLKNKPKYDVSGYITLRFMVNCEGKTSFYKVMQTDEKYATTHFDKNLVNDLYAFVQTLDQWKKCKSRNGNEPINYKAYLSFKFKNGKIVNIIP